MKTLREEEVLSSAWGNMGDLHEWDGVKMESWKESGSSLGFKGQGYSVAEITEKRKSTPDKELSLPVGVGAIDSMAHSRNNK